MSEKPTLDSAQSAAAPNRRPTRTCILLCLLALGYGTAAVAEQDEPAAILEFGVVPNRSLTEHTWSAGPTAAIEVTPIEHWLELEAGVTFVRAHGSTEFDTDLLFKKPWTLSKRLEVMAGIGPEWVHTQENGRAANALGGEAAVDFMFWPFAKRRFGWYAEPALDYRFGNVHEMSFGISAGLLIGVGGSRRK